MTRALAWFSADSMYPADWEPSGDDCVSPALTEAELMARILPPPEFADWLAMFLPGLEWGRPGTLFTPAVAGIPRGSGAGPGAGRPAPRPERHPVLVLAADRQRPARG